MSLQDTYAALGLRALYEEQHVRELGDRIGYGRMMQLAEQIWNEKQPGGAHGVGCCTAFLVPCPWTDGSGNHVQCDWCCGAGRVTKRVAEAIRQEGAGQG